MKKLFYITFISFFFTSLTIAQEKIPAAVEDYVKILKIARSKKNISIERTYSLGMIAMNSLGGDILGRDESDIDPKWLKSLREKMEGFELYPNTESFVANVNISFFLELAKKNGIAGDIAFFELTMKTQPNAWPVYLQQMTDYKGCAVYDGTLTNLHKEWSSFQVKFPKLFIEATKKRIKDIEHELVDSNCSCDEKAEPILNELQKFIKENPKFHLNSKIQKRMKDIKSKKVPVNNCN